MKILHITPNSNGYEEVTLISNRINKTNSLALIKNVRKSMTGGYLINDTPEIRYVLDSISKDKQFKFVKSFKDNPFVKLYASDEDLLDN